MACACAWDVAPLKWKRLSIRPRASFSRSTMSDRKAEEPRMQKSNMKSRRDFLAGLGTAGAGVIALATTGGRSSAQSNAAKLAAPRRIIDVHHHIMPPFYIHEHRRDQLKVGPGIAQIFEWTPQQAIERMDGSGVATSLLSISTPGPWFGQV